MQSNDYAQELSTNDEDLNRSLNPPSSSTVAPIIIENKIDEDTVNLQTIETEIEDLDDSGTQQLFDYLSAKFGLQSNKQLNSDDNELEQSSENNDNNEILSNVPDSTNVVASTQSSNNNDAFSKQFVDINGW